MPTECLRIKLLWLLTLCAKSFVFNLLDSELRSTGFIAMMLKKSCIEYCPPVKVSMLPLYSSRSTFPFLITLCVLLSLGSVGVLGTAPAIAQGRKQNAEQKFAQREDADFELRLGQQAQQQGQLDKAIFHLLKAESIYQTFGDEEGLGTTLDYLAEAYVVAGDPRSAESAFRRRLAVARDRQDLQAQIFALNNLGNIFLKQGNLNIAEEVFTDALAIARSVENTLGAGTSLSNLGLTASLRGDYPEAIKRFNTALLFHNKSQDLAGSILTITNLADAQLYGGSPREALLSYIEALAVAKELRDFENQFRALEGQFYSRKALAQTDLAFRELNRWATFAREQKNLTEEFKSVENAAFFYAELGDRPNAEIFLKKAMDLATTIGATDRLAFLQQKLSQVQYGEL